MEQSRSTLNKFHLVFAYTFVFPLKMVLYFKYEGKKMVANIVVGFFVAAIVVLAVWKIIKDKKDGKHSCNYGGSCGGCPMAGQCHKKEK